MTERTTDTTVQTPVQLSETFESAESLSPLELYEQKRFADLFSVFPTLPEAAKQTTLQLLAQKETVRLLATYFDLLELDAANLEYLFGNCVTFETCTYFFENLTQTTFTYDEIIATLLKVNTQLVILAFHNPTALSAKTIELLSQEGHDYSHTFDRLIDSCTNDGKIAILTHWLATYEYDTLESCIEKTVHIPRPLVDKLQSILPIEDFLFHVSRYESFDHASVFAKLSKANKLYELYSCARYFPECSETFYSEQLTEHPEHEILLVTNFSNFRHDSVLADIEQSISANNSKHFDADRKLRILLNDQIPPFTSVTDQEELFTLLATPKTVSRCLAIALSTKHFNLIPQSELLVRIAGIQNGYSALYDHITNPSYESGIHSIPNSLFQKLLLFGGQDSYTLFNKTILSKIDNWDQKMTAQFFEAQNLTEYISYKMYYFTEVESDFFIRNFPETELASAVYRHILWAKKVFTKDEVFFYLKKHEDYSFHQMLTFGNESLKTYIGETATDTELRDAFDVTTKEGEHAFLYFKSKYVVQSEQLTVSDRIEIILAEVQNKGTLLFEILYNQPDQLTYTDLQDVLKVYPNLFTFNQFSRFIHCLKWETFPTSFFQKVLAQASSDKKFEEIISCLPWILTHLSPVVRESLTTEISESIAACEQKDIFNMVEYYLSISRIDVAVFIVSEFAKIQESQDFFQLLRLQVGTEKISKIMQKLLEEENFEQAHILQKKSNIFTLDDSHLSLPSETPTENSKDTLSTIKRDVETIDLFKDFGLFYAHKFLEYELAQLHNQLTFPRTIDHNFLVTQPQEYSSTIHRASLDHIEKFLENQAEAHTQKVLHTLTQQLVVATDFHTFSQDNLRNTKDAYLMVPQLPQLLHTKSDLVLALQKHIKVYEKIDRKDWMMIAMAAYRLVLPNAKENASFLLDLITDLEHGSGFIFSRGYYEKFTLSDNEYSHDQYRAFLSFKSSCASFTDWISHLRSHNYVPEPQLKDLESIYKAIQHLKTAPTRAKGYE